MSRFEDWLDRLLELAEKARLSQDCVLLGAHIYAWMLEIQDEHPITIHAPHSPLPPVYESHVDTICWLLRRAENREDPNAVYWDLQRALSVVDLTVSHTLDSDWGTVVASPHFRGGDVYVYGKRGLARGRQDWPLKTLRSALQESAPEDHSPRPPRHEPNDELRYLRFFWLSRQRDFSFGKSTYDSTRCKLHVDNPLEKDSHGLRVALCPLVQQAHPHFEFTSPPESFHVKRSDPMKNPEALKAHLAALIKEAEQRAVHLVILPELTVCQPAREHIARLLRQRSSTYPYAVLAGSFHIWKEQSAHQHTDRASPPVNEAILLARSFPLLTHHKRGLFILPRKAVTEEFFPGCSLPVQESWVREGIRRGSRFEYLETIFGTIAVLICADLIDPDTQEYLSVVRTLRPDLLLVVAMSPETECFRERAQELSERGVGTLMVNAGCIIPPEPREGQVPCLAIAHLGLFQHPEAPPVFVRWRGDTFTVERRTYGPDHQAWRAFDPGPEHGVSWLGSAGMKFGLILDIGTHQDWLKMLKN